MVSVRVPGLRLAPAARSLVRESLALAGSAHKPAARELLRKAAGIDGNLRLDSEEATLVRDSFVAASSGGALNLAQATAIVDAAVAERLRAKNAAGVRAYFSSTTDDMRQAIIDAMTDTITRANGRPVDINILIFSFVDPKIGDAIKALAAAHDHVTFRLVADFGELSNAQNHQPPRLAKAAQDEGLAIEVKYKKDAPYIWDAAKKRPRYNHSSTKGLNHHKGFAAFIDGQPDRLVTGSFNWSPTADNSNYENLLVIDASDPINRRLIAAFQAEFVAFFNSTSALNTRQALAHKAQLTNQLRVANGLPPITVPDAGPVDAPYVPRAPGASFDVNDLSDSGWTRLRAAVKDATTSAAIAREIATYGPVRSFDELLERVSKVKKLPAERREALESAILFGAGAVPINSATADELTRALAIPKTTALAIVAQRQAVGELESLEALAGLPGMSPSILERVRARSSLRTGQPFFSARPYDAPQASRGWDAGNAARTVPVMGENGVVTEHPASLSAGVIDLLNRAKPGDVAKIAMYGISASTPEYAAVIAAVERGVEVRMVLNDDFNEGVAAALAAMEANGLPVHVRIQKAKTMHEKFGVVNDDLFAGSANFSSSSAEKHTEDRFVLKNDPALAAGFHAEFDLLWAKSKPVA